LCDVGWVGPACQMRACPGDCTGRGTCSQDSTCVCFPGWKGDDCSVLACPGSTVSGHELPCGGAERGACGDDAMCSCHDGWTGPTCGRPTCRGATPCGGRGSCSVDARLGMLRAICECDAPYYGDGCERIRCVDDCSSRGTCIQPPDADAGKCSCEPGWWGETCAKSVCPDDCSGRGECRADGVCVCASGWGGASCANATCPAANVPAGHMPAELLLLQSHEEPAEPQCGPNGVCNATTRACGCALGWSGPGCHMRACPSNCDGHGICGSEVQGECECQPYRAGEACERETPCASGCDRHGSCSANGCVCDSGWAGADCEHKICMPSTPGRLACLGQGRCITGRCECERLDGTAACLSDSLCMHSCNYNGHCDVALGACVCENGWRGEWCQFRSCASGCETHGWCDVDGRCVCDAGWTGTSCMLQKCPRDCSQRGECLQATLSSGNGLAQCRCHRGWAGPDCSQLDPDQSVVVYLQSFPPSISHVFAEVEATAEAPGLRAGGAQI